MVGWRLFDRDDAAWDDRLAGLEESSVFQSSLWARHKAASGWRPLRLASGNAAVQGLVKRLPLGARLLWARGGPAGDPAAWDASLRRELLARAGGSVVYARVCPYRPADPETTARLTAAGWKRPGTPLDKPFTYRVALQGGAERKMSSNWAHNLRRGLSRAGQAQAWDSPDPVEMEGLYRGLESLKGLPPQHRAPELASMLGALGPRLILRRVCVGGKTVAMRACAVFGHVAMDLLAAAGPEARQIYASHVLLDALIAEAGRAGARFYDLGGADPVAAKGVADFKRGTGAAETETLGEWDAASPAAARAGIGALIAARMRP